MKKIYLRLTMLIVVFFCGFKKESECSAQAPAYIPVGNKAGTYRQFEYINLNGKVCLARANRRPEIVGMSTTDPEWQWSGDGGKTWANQKYLTVPTDDNKSIAEFRMHANSKTQRPHHYRMWTDVKINDGKWQMYPCGITDGKGKKWKVVVYPDYIEGYEVSFALVPR